MSLDLSIAGLVVALHIEDPAVKRQLEARYDGFMTAAEPSLEITVDLQPPRRGAVRPDEEPGFQNGSLVFNKPGFDGQVDLQLRRARIAIASHHPVESLDYFVRAAYALLAFEAGGFLFHGAGIVRPDAAAQSPGAGVFFGPSGSGKTTLARLSGDGLVLNDDLVLLLPKGPTWQVYATPFWNPSQNQPAPAASGRLAGLFRLAQAQRPYLSELGLAEGLAEVVASLPIISSDPSRSPAILQRGKVLLGAVPAFRLHFRPDNSVWEVVDPVLG